LTLILRTGAGGREQVVAALLEEVEEVPVSPGNFEALAAARADKAPHPASSSAPIAPPHAPSVEERAEAYQ
jgi:hypothetical protein